MSTGQPTPPPTGSSSTQPVYPDKDNPQALSIIAKDCHRRFEALCKLCRSLEPEDAEQLHIIDLFQFRVELEKARYIFRHYGLNISDEVEEYESLEGITRSSPKWGEIRYQVFNSLKIIVQAVYRGKWQCYQ